MLENLTLLAIIITVFWMAALAYYLYTSRQQNEIREDLDDLREKLEHLEKRND